MQSTHSERSPSVHSQRAAAAAAQQLYRSFPQQNQAVDIETYLAGIVVVLAHYPPDVMARVVHPLNGLPGKLKFIPTIAEVKEACEEAQKSAQYAADLQARLGPPIDKEAQREWRASVPKGAATTSELCARYGIRAIPPGWDAIDVVQQHARHGADFPAYVERVLGGQDSGKRAGGMFDAVVVKARQAQRIRQQYEAMGVEPVYCGDDIVSPELAGYAREHGARMDQHLAERDHEREAS